MLYIGMGHDGKGASVLSPAQLAIFHKHGKGKCGIHISRLNIAAAPCLECLDWYGYCSVSAGWVSRWDGCGFSCRNLVSITSRQHRTLCYHLCSLLPIVECGSAGCVSGVLMSCAGGRDDL